MFKGTVNAIFIAAQSGDDPARVENVRAVPGKGLEGDRNFHKDDPLAAVTLIELEAIEALNRDYAVEIDPGASRRNIVTQGVPLNHLIGKEFCVGNVRMRGTKMCEPCNYLAGKTQPKVLPGLVHRGGIRAEILSEGAIAVGDDVQVLGE